MMGQFSVLGAFSDACITVLSALDAFGLQYFSGYLHEGFIVVLVADVHHF